jgi:hypothetical protein
MRLWVAVLLLAVAAPAEAKRVSAGGMTLEPPPGWKLEARPDGSARLVNAAGTVAWCFFPAEPARDLGAWFDAAWRGLAAAHATVQAGDIENNKTSTGLAGRSRGGVMADGSGHARILLLAVVHDGARVGPTLFEFTDGDAVTAEAAAISTASDSIDLGPKRGPPKRAFAGSWSHPLDGTRATATAAPPPADHPFKSRWATSTGSADALRPGGLGASRRQYDFRPDGTYTFHAEHWGGSLRPNWWYVVDERGTWSLAGARVTVAPDAATGTVKDGDGRTQETRKLALEKVTYAWQVVFFEGIHETNLVLTPEAKTQRDGDFAANDRYPGSYLLSNTYKPDWRFAP